MAANSKPDKEAVRAWLRQRRQSTAPPPSIEQIREELFSRRQAGVTPSIGADMPWLPEPRNLPHDHIL